jgi:PAS domain S-box-containing protein
MTMIHRPKHRGKLAESTHSDVDELRSRLVAIVDFSNDAILSKSLDGVISTWNSAAERLFGYSKTEAIGQPITKIVPHELLDEENEILRRLRIGERIEHYETRRVGRDGRSVDVSLTISPLFDSTGAIVGASTIARDITETKQIEAALRESQAQQAREIAGARTLQGISTRLISESTPHSLYKLILDAATELVAADAASVQMLNPDHTLTLLASKNFHPESAAFWRRVELGSGSTCANALVDNQRVVVADIETCDFMAGTPDLQEYRRCGIRAVQSTPLQSRSGRPLGMLSTHWRTIHTPTEDEFRLFDALARQAADSIDRTLAEDAVRESEQRFRLIANTAPVMIWLSDVDKQVIYVNQPWLNFTGWPVDVVPGHRWIELIHPDDVERCGDAYVKAFDQRQPFQVEHRLRRHDGEYRWTVSTGVPRYDAKGSFTGYVGTAIDITERKLAEEVLSTVSQRLIEAQEQERTRLAQELHDDIGQQLVMVLLRLEAVKQRVEVPMPELGRDIGSVIETATTLSRDVQSLSRRLHSTQLKHLGLEAAARAVCAELSTESSLDVQFHSEESSLAGMPEDVSLCLYRVLQEALQNAVKHGRSRHIDVRLRNDASNVELIVRDSGIGFDPNTAFQGRGLGLVGMRERLKLVGGEVTIDASPAAGTTIRARVPLNFKGTVA